VRKYCDEYVCVRVSVCLSVRENISGTTRARFTKFCMHVNLWLWLGPAPASLRYTSGFVDEMFFFYNGPYSGMNFTTKDRFRSNILIYLKSDRIPFPIIKGHNFN